MNGEPTDEELAAAMAAVRAMLRRRGGRREGGSRWMRAGRIEAVQPPPQPASWASAERPR
jgi:hypothetical protein